MKMAALGSAKSASRLGQKGRTRPATVPCIHTPARVPTIEEVRCPVCLDILLEPVTMPCRHSVCLHCFQRTVQFSLCCPRCRLRVSSWARKQSREKRLVNTELWDMVRKSYPDKCKRRMEQRAGEAVGDGRVSSLLLFWQLTAKICPCKFKMTYLVHLFTIIALTICFEVLYKVEKGVKYTWKRFPWFRLGYWQSKNASWYLWSLGTWRQQMCLHKSNLSRMSVLHIPHIMVYFAISFTNLYWKRWVVYIIVVTWHVPRRTVDWF